MAITGQVGLNVQLTDTRSGDLESGSLKTVMQQAWSLTAAGVGADQADLLWSDKRTLAASANEDIDVAGALTSLFGAAVFVKVKAVVIVSLPANTTNLTVIRQATTGLPFLLADGDGFILGPGDIFLITRRGAAGIAVSAGADDVINVANASGASADYYILILGTAS
jgi:hypothetical protein